MPLTIESERINVIVSREEVEACDTSSVVQLLKSCVTSSERALSLFEKLDVAFDGYNQQLPTRIFWAWVWRLHARVSRIV